MGLARRRLRNRISLWKHRHFYPAKILVSALVVMTLLSTAPIALYVIQRSTYSSKVHYQVADVPVAKVGVVLGAQSDSAQLEDVVDEQVQAAVELYMEGKVQQLIMSAKSADAMVERATELGVPADALLADYSSSTYETCYHAQNAYDLGKAVLVTQESHLLRAIYTCTSLGVKVDGYVADIDEVDYSEDLVQEMLAMTRATWEVNIAPPVFATAAANR